jgi:hypothetical protein
VLGLRCQWVQHNSEWKEGGGVPRSVGLVQLYESYQSLVREIVHTLKFHIMKEAIKFQEFFILVYVEVRGTYCR